MQMGHNFLIWKGLERPNSMFQLCHIFVPTASYIWRNNIIDNFPEITQKSAVDKLKTKHLKEVWNARSINFSLEKKKSGKAGKCVALLPQPPVLDSIPRLSSKLSQFYGFLQDR